MDGEEDGQKSGQNAQGPWPARVENLRNTALRNEYTSLSLHHGSLWHKRRDISDRGEARTRVSHCMFSSICTDCSKYIGVCFPIYGDAPFPQIAARDTSSYTKSKAKVKRIYSNVSATSEWERLNTKNLIYSRVVDRRPVLTGLVCAFRCVHDGHHNRPSGFDGPGNLGKISRCALEPWSCK